LTDEKFPHPDITIALRASEQTIQRRIVERGRVWELNFMLKYPDYFRRIVETFNEWLSLNRYTRKTIVIDTDKYNLKPGSDVRELVAREIYNWTTYYIGSPNQLNGRADGGGMLLLPDFSDITPKAFYDIPPSLDSQSKRLQGH